MPSMESFLNTHNKKVLNSNEPQNDKKDCNCMNKNLCPLDGNCLEKSIIYKAEVTSTDGKKCYIGCTENEFKTRYYDYKTSFKYDKYKNKTSLSNYIWNLNDRKIEYRLKWSIVGKANAYSNATKKCNLCLNEKYFIMKADKKTLINKRSEMISKCRHKNKFSINKLNKSNESAIS